MLASADRVVNLRRTTETAVLAALIVAIGGCGGADQKPSPPRLDDAFIVRIVPHEQTAAALARDAAGRARGGAVRRLARTMVATRRRTLPALQAMLVTLPADGSRGSTGVSAAEAADDVRPDTLRNAHPVDTAFLTLLTRHGQGALALVRAEVRDGRDPAVKAIAQRMAVDLTREQMRLLRALRDVAKQRVAG